MSEFTFTLGTARWFVNPTHHTITSNAGVRGKYQVTGGRYEFDDGIPFDVRNVIKDHLGES